MSCHTFLGGICQAFDSRCFNLVDLIELRVCKKRDFGFLTHSKAWSSKTETVTHEDKKLLNKGLVKQVEHHEKMQFAPSELR